METRRRGSIGSHRDFFHLVGSPIRTKKMSFDYDDIKAPSPNQVRSPETPPAPGMPFFPGGYAGVPTLVLGHRQKQLISVCDQGMQVFDSYPSTEAIKYSSSEAPSSMSIETETEGGDISNPMKLDGARQAGIPLFLSNWFDCDSSKPRSGSPRLNGANNQFLQPHQNVNMADVALTRVIGEGAFGKVFKATWKNRQVAVKVLIRQDLTADVVREFETEVKIMSFLHHPNICMLLGACLESTSRALVIELVDHGSLWGVLRTRRNILTDRMRAKFAADTARGMSYLHNFNLPILHRDMKSPNLLVERDFSIKISDFGLSRVKAQIQTMTGNCGTVQWMAYVGNDASCELVFLLVLTFHDVAFSDPKCWATKSTRRRRTFSPSALSCGRSSQASVRMTA